MNFMMLLLIVLPILVGIINMFIKKEMKRNRFIFWSLLLNLGVAICVCFNGELSLNLIQFTDSLSLSLHVDFIARLFILLINFIFFMAITYSFEYMKHEHNVNRFFMFFCFTLAALNILCLADNLFTMYLAYELMTLMSFPLVMHEGTEAAIKAGFKYLGYSVFGAGLGLLGIFFIAQYADTLTFAYGGILDMVKVSGNENLLYTIYLLMMIGFGGKAGMFPLHAWLPTAHPIAPSGASAVLSGLITKAGVLAIIRTTLYVFGIEFLSGSFAQNILLVLTIFTIFMGSMLAYKEKVLKKRLAYSTISQVSYALFAIFVMSELSFKGAILQIVYHALAKDILFLCAGAIIFNTVLKRVDELKAIGKKMPYTLILFTLASLSLIGIPPLGGFISKWYIAIGATDTVIGIIGIAILMVSALLTAGYTLDIVINGFIAGSDFNYKKNKLKDVSSTMLVPMALLCIVLLVVSVYPTLLNILR